VTHGNHLEMGLFIRNRIRSSDNMVDLVSCGRM